MLNKIDQYFNFQQRVLNLRAYRSELLASNIANNETPGYKAVDFNFSAALQSKMSGQIALAHTHANHRGQRSAANPQPNISVQHRHSVQPSLDGNTVDMDIERAAFAENALQFQTILDVINRRIASLKAAIQG